MGLISKRTSPGLLKFLAFIYFCLSVTLLVFAVISFGGFTQKYQAGEKSVTMKIGDNALAKSATFLGGFLGLIMMVLLFLSAKGRTGIFACPFGLIGIFAGFALLTVMGLCLTQRDPLYYKEQLCNTKQDALGGKSGSELAKEMNMAFINPTMCSPTCPCPADHHDIIEDDIDEATLNKVFKRTWKEKSKDFKPMVFGADDGGKEYERFSDCFNEKIKTGNHNGDSPILKAAIDDFKRKENTLKYYEEEYECSGMCDTPLFYSTKPIMDGLPEEDCIDSIIENVMDNKILAGIAGGTGVLFLLCGLCSIPCGGGKKDKHNELAEN